MATQPSARARFALRSTVAFAASLAVVAAAFVAASPAQATGGHDAIGVVTGHVTNSAGGVYADVSLLSTGDVDVSALTTTTDPTDGSFEIDDVPVGYAYTVQALPDDDGVGHDDTAYLPVWSGGVDGVTNQAIAGTVTPADDTPVDVTLVTTLGASLSGRTVDEANPDGTTNGLAGVDVQAQLSDGTVVGADATTGADGSYTLKGLPTGDYYVFADPSASTAPRVADFGPQYYPSSGSIAGATKLHLTAGQPTVTGKNVLLASGGEIDGVVDDDRTPAHPIANAFVTVYSAGVAITSGDTDASGAFQVKGVPAGSGYTIGVAAPSGSAYLDTTPGPLSAFTTGSTTIVPGHSLALTSAIHLTTGLTISGTITDGTNPVSGVSVSAEGNTDGASGNSPVTTGSDGTYTIVGLYPGETYDVTADGSSVGYTTSVRTTASLTTNLATFGFTLSSGGTIKGSVLTHAGVGNPAVDATVTLATAAGVTVSTQQTDGNGDFEFDGVALGGSYTVAVAAPGGSADIDSAAQTVTGPTTPGAVVSVPPIRLQLGATISGTIKSDNGTPGNGDDIGLAGVTVTVTGQSTDATGTAVTGTGGTYSIIGLPGDVYDVAVDGSDVGFTSTTTTLTSPIQTGATKTGVDFTLTSAGDITGTVVDHATAPVVGATVTVFAGTTRVGTTTTGAGGTFDVPGVPAAVGGTYTLEVDAPAESPDLDKTGIPVAGAVVAGHPTAAGQIQLQLGATISGVITNTATPTSAPLAGATVAVTGRNTGTAASATTASDGSYSITGLPGDTYDVTVDDSIAGYALWTSPAAGYAVAAGGSQTVNAQLTNGGAVSGQLYDDAGAAVANATITLFKGQVTVATASSSADGSFSLPGVPADTGYSIQATAPEGSPDVDSTIASIAPVTASHITTADIHLIKGATISGTVTSGATPLAGIVVEADGTSNGTTTTATTDNAGHYSIIGLPADTSYTVFTTDPAGIYASATVTTGAVVIGSSASALTENFTLTSAGWVVGAAGSVLTSAGHPAIGATVNVVGVDGQTVLGSATVGVDGFIVLGIPAGTGYKLDIVPAQGSGDLESLFPTAIPAVTAGHETDVTGPYQLQLGGTISGTVTDNAGAHNPVSGAIVTIGGANTGAGDAVTTDGNGHFSLGGLPADTYSVQVDATAKGFAIQTTTNLALAAGQSLTPLSYQLVPGITVTGTVLTSAGSGHPAVGATVTLQTAPDTDGDSVVLGTTQTLGDGTWSIPSIGPTSTAQLAITAPEGSADLDYGPTTISAPIPAPTDLVTSVALATVTLTAGASISGTITGDGTNQGEVTVKVFAIIGGTLTQVADSDQLTTWTGNTVAFTVNRLPADTYYIEAVPGDDSSATAYAPQWLGGGTAQVGSTAITVQAGDAKTGANFTLQSGGSVSGTVKDSDGNPIFNAAVNLYYAGSGWGSDSDGNPLAGSPVDGRSSPTDANGSFTITGIAPGVYTLDAEDPTDGTGNPVGGLVNVFYPNPATYDPSRSSTFSYAYGDANNGTFAVTAGSTTAWNAVLPQSGSINVTVLNPDGTVDTDPALAPAIYDHSGSTAGTIGVDDSGNPIADGDGSYTYASVPPGNYTASVTLSDGTAEYLGGVFYYDQGDQASLDRAWYSFTSTPGQTVNYTIQLAKVAGTVTDLKGKVSEAQVSIVEGDPSGTTLSDDGTGNQNPATTNSKGTFTFEPVIATGIYAPTYTFQVDSGDDTHQASQQYPGIGAGPSIKLSLNLLFGATPKPIITGTATAGGKLAAIVPWTPLTTNAKYQWLLGGKAITGATKSAYTVPKGTKAGSKISVTVTATAKGYETKAATSAAIVVGKKFSRPTAPAIAGVPGVGTPTYVNLPAWTDKPTFAYQWLANGQAISGATKAAYAPGAKLAGAKLSVVVTASKSGFGTAVYVSKAVAVAKALKTKPSVTLSLPKKLVVGAKITATIGNVKKLKGVKLAYQWFANGFAIPKATKASFAPTKAQIGAKLTVLVTATAKGTAGNVLSKATGPVKKK